MEWSIYNHLFYSEKSNAYLLYSSLSNMIIKLDEESYKSVINIKDNLNSIDIDKGDYKFLFDGRFIVESNETEVNKIVLTTLKQRFSSTSLSLTIAPTRDCNFNCPYCYEANRMNKRMNADTRRAVVDYVKSYKDIKSLNVIWYGGEPTTEIETIKLLSKDFSQIIDNYNSFMVTNGYCLDKLVNIIQELRISGFQITLDGTQESHNLTRHLINGKGTYNKILSNIDLILAKHSVNIVIRMNISTNNSEQYVHLYNELQKRYGNKVYLYPAFVNDYNGSCLLGTCYDDCTKKAQFLNQLFEEHGIYTKDLYPSRINKGCMLQTMNSFVIGPDGELYKCWHHLGITTKVIGSIFKSPSITNIDLLADLMTKGDVLQNDACKSCVLFPSCYGGCTDDKMRNSDYCIPAKAMLEDFINIRYILKTKNQ